MSFYIRILDIFQQTSYLYAMSCIQHFVRRFSPNFTRYVLMVPVIIWILMMLRVEYAITSKRERGTQQSKCKVLSSEHNIGKWVRTEFKPEETWPCCGQDGAFQYYVEQCGSKSGYNLSEYRNDTRSYIGRRDFFAHSGGNGCSGHCEPTIGSIIAARWTPSQCYLPLFDAAYFCNNVLGNRTILVVGDSTMEQTASVLMNAVHYHCPERIRHVEGGPLVGKKHRSMCPLWNDSAKYYNADIILLAAGPYIKNEIDYQMLMEEVHRGYVNNFAQSEKVVIWKTINPGGSPEFGLINEMPNFNDPVLVARWEQKGYHHDWWGWDLFPRFDAMAKEFFRSKGVPVLDVEPLYYCTDNHPWTDIHHCAHGDGALRVIPRLLQSLLEELDE